VPFKTTIHLLFAPLREFIPSQKQISRKVAKKTKSTGGLPGMTGKGSLLLQKNLSRRPCLCCGRGSRKIPVSALPKFYVYGSPAKILSNGN
jgi:hypothetical protein